MEDIRNVAIIAHVDHGKTTLVDRILQHVHLFRSNQVVNELILDSNDLERERGITILSKNVSVRYKGVKINIIDTPGHADFGGEVERVLNMADGVLLIVDAFEGPMPQTRFVLQKAIDLGLKPILVINKVDKPNCNPLLTQEKVFDLMLSLDASDSQLDFPTVFGSAKHAWMGPDHTNPTKDIGYLLDLILSNFQMPTYPTGSLQLRITSLDYSSYTGRIAIGKITRGTLTAGDQVSIIKRDKSIQKATIKELFTFEGLAKEKTKKTVYAGEICAILGIDSFDIGDTICDFISPEALAPIVFDEPTMSMLFASNDSPFFGREGKYVTSRQLRDRLYKETEKNLALRVEDTDSADKFNVYGRGILHLSILIETMRREGFELQLGQPRVIVKEINDIKCEPCEYLTIQVPDKFSGKVIELITQRKGEILNIELKDEMAKLEFNITSRALIGIRNILLNLTEGEAIIAHRFNKFAPWRDDLTISRNGALVSIETGKAIAYSIDKLQDRGKFFIFPGEDVYEGQILGEHTRYNDLGINVTKTKKLTNIRASGTDDKAIITPPIRFSLEESMEYIAEDEMIEVTPKSIRLRKILLSEFDRKKASKIQ